MFNDRDTFATQAELRQTFPWDDFTIEVHELFDEDRERLKHYHRDIYIERLDLAFDNHPYVREGNGFKAWLALNEAGIWSTNDENAKYVVVVTPPPLPSVGQYVKAWKRVADDDRMQAVPEVVYGYVLKISGIDFCIRKTAQTAGWYDAWEPASNLT